MNGNIHLKLLKIKKNKTQNDLILKENKNKTIYNTPKKRKIPIVSGYFPEDFSINIYKSTSLYKKRYQIEPLPLKKQLKLIKIRKKTIKSEKLIKTIKNDIKENNFSSDLLRLLKSNKIDRFAKRYLEKTNNKKNKLNNYINKNVRRILTPNNNQKEENKQTDEDKITNDDLINQNIFSPLNNTKKKENKGLNKDNMIDFNSEITINNIMISSSSQTNNINQNEEYKRKETEVKNKILTFPQSPTILKNDYIFDSLTSYNNSQRNIKNIEKNNRRKIKQYIFPKKYLILDKNKNVKLFSPEKKINYFNIINKLENKNKLVFSFYDPNDKHIKLMKEFEKKLKTMDTNEKSTNFSANIY